MNTVMKCGLMHKWQKHGVVGILYDKIILLRVPVATVRLRAKGEATKIIPAKMAAMRIAIRTAYQWVEQGRQCEIPRDKLITIST